MRFNVLGVLFVILCCSCSNVNHKLISNNQISIRDSVLIYKIQGLKEFTKVADYWGDDTESYWAFEQANNILDSISDYYY